MKWPSLPFLTRPATASEAARALNAHARATDCQRIADRTAELRAEIAAGIRCPLAPKRELGW